MPQAVIDSYIVLQGPPGAVLEDVFLHNPEAIAAVVVVADFDIINQEHFVVPGLPDILERYPEAVAAGARVADIYRSIRRMATARHEVPDFFDIINAALKNPSLTAADYRRSVQFHFSTIARNPRVPSQNGTSHRKEALRNSFGELTHLKPRLGCQSHINGP